MNAAIDPTKPERNLTPARPAAAPELLKYLKRGRVLLLAGKPIDGDNVASAIALRRLLLNLDIKADLGSGDKIPENLQFLPDTEHFNYQPDFLAYESIVVLDCGELSLTGFQPQLEKLLQTDQFATVINIDHHLQDPPFGHLSHVDPGASATGLLIFRLARAWRVSIDAPTATALLATLYYDTGSFQHSNVDSETLRMAAECVRLGADAPDIAKRMYRSKPLKVLKLWGRALARASYHKDTGVVSSVITQQDLRELNVAPDEISGIVGLLAHVPSGNFGLLLTDDGAGSIKGSLRSNERKSVNVARIANLLGGGGHKLASGFRVEGTIKEDNGVYRVV